MRKISLTIVNALVFTTLSYAQIKYEKGYFISNNDSKTECLIYNMDWSINPVEFIYKSTEDAKPLTIGIQDVKEFGVYNFSKYVRAEVNIDTSAEDLNKLSRTKNPEFIKKTVFLEVVFEGPSSLYSYENDELTRFFYQTKDSIQQLIHKKYIVYAIDEFHQISADTAIQSPNKHPVNTYTEKVATNNYYQQQLYNDVNCRNLPLSNITTMQYYKSNLVKYFRNENKCLGTQYIDYEKLKGVDFFNLRIKPGMDFSSFDFHSPSFDFSFDNKLLFNIGLEQEFILPANRNKWGLILYENYHYFKDDFEYEYANWTTYQCTIDYKALDIQAGIRYYFFLSQNSKIFLNWFYLMSFDLGESSVAVGSTTYELGKNDSWSFGAGFVYKKFGIDARYYMPQDVISEFNNVEGNYKRFSLMLSYCIF
jgi:hypothetical protein